MSGTPCFAGTRVPVKNLFDYLEGGETLDELLDGFPGVTREQAVAVLERSRASLLEGPRRPVRILLDQCVDWRLGRALSGHA